MPIGLGMRHLQEFQSDVETFANIPDSFTIELSSVVRDDGFRDSKPTHQVLLEEPPDFLCRDQTHGLCLGPFGEIIHHYEWFGGYSLVCPFPLGRRGKPRKCSRVVRQV